MVHVGVQEDRKDIFGGVVIGAGKEFSEDFEGRAGRQCEFLWRDEVCGFEIKVCAT